MSVYEFFEQNPVFTHEEFKQYLISQNTNNPNTQRETLSYHLKKQNIIRIRRGFFASIPLASRGNTFFSIDPYLIAGRISHDAVLSHHTAFDFYGISHSIFHQFTFMSEQKIRPFIFQETKFICLPFPKMLLKDKKNNMDIVTADRQGLSIKVTSIERTLVDALDRPEYAGGWEEIWQTAKHISILNFDKLTEYAISLNNATTIAKLGFFLEQHKEKFHTDEKVLMRLEKKKPNGVHYLERSKREAGKLIQRWNLIVPDYIIEQAWEEPTNDLI
jgi:predicted transcriptional regulator of viral defense system